MCGSIHNILNESHKYIFPKVKWDKDQMSTQSYGCGVDNKKCI